MFKNCTRGDDILDDEAGLPLLPLALYHLLRSVVLGLLPPLGRRK